MAVTTGSYDKPAATLGTKPSEAWTATTTAAGLAKKPQAGKARHGGGRDCHMVEVNGTEAETVKGYRSIFVAGLTKLLGGG